MLERIYLAGMMVVAGTVKNREENREKAKDIWYYKMLKDERTFTLESFWYKDRFSRDLEEESIKIFLDSGAVTWYNECVKKGVEVDDKMKREFLDNYIAFVHKYKSKLYGYVNLDVIYDPKRSQENQEYMELNGLNPLPVFHFGEDMKWFIRMIERYDYVGVGGAVSGAVTQKAQQRMTDELFELVYKRGDKVRIHGFGRTNWNAICQFPWYSVDSTTWLQQAAYGGILIPKYGDSGFAYKEAPYVIKVSELSRFKEGQNPHYTYKFSESERERILEYLEKVGVDSKRLEEDYAERHLANVLYYENLMKAARDWKDEYRYLRSEEKFF